MVQSSMKGPTAKIMMMSKYAPVFRGSSVPGSVLASTRQSEARVVQDVVQTNLAAL